MLKSALLVAAGIVVGAGAIQGLHAATGGGYYTVAEINVKDRATYDKDLPAVLSTIKDAGGVYLAGGFDKATLEYGSPGVPPVANRDVIIRYDSKDGYEKGHQHQEIRRRTGKDWDNLPASRRGGCGSEVKELPLTSFALSLRG